MADFQKIEMRGVIPGRAGLILVAVAAIPLIFKACKPAMKRIGEEFTKFGDKLQAEAAKIDEEEAKAAAKARDEAAVAAAKVADNSTATGTATASTSTKGKMKSETKKTGKTAGGVPVTTASPTGQEEMAQQNAAESAGAKAPPKKKPAAKPAAQKKPVGDQPQNPKKTSVKKPKT